MNLNDKNKVNAFTNLQGDVTQGGRITSFVRTDLARS